jgi:hypothetical protein
MRTKLFDLFRILPAKRPASCIPDEKSKTTAVVIPTVKPDSSLRNEILLKVQEQGLVTVHFRYETFFGSRIRIWNSTYLIDKATGKRSKLLHALNITFFPVWTELPDYSTVQFTLFFEPLSRSCEVFDLLEDIPETGGFTSNGIERNKRDVYFLKNSNRL